MFADVACMPDAGESGAGAPSEHDRLSFLPAKIFINSYVKVKILVAEYRLPILLAFAGTTLCIDRLF